MPTVYVTTYEVISDGVPIADEHFHAIDAAHAAHWQFVEQLGGKGFRPAHDGGLRSVFFETIPAGWRKIGNDKGLTEAVPRKGSTAGKDLVKRIAELPRAPDAWALASRLGYSTTEFACDGTKLYFPTAIALSFPASRMFLRLPRFSEDGFNPEESFLRALPESEFMRAVEDHNAEARRLREAGE
jgi:hypothetical protein